VLVVVAVVFWFFGFFFCVGFVLRLFLWEIWGLID